MKFDVVAYAPHTRSKSSRNPELPGKVLKHATNHTWRTRSRAQKRKDTAAESKSHNSAGIVTAVAPDSSPVASNTCTTTGQDEGNSPAVVADLAQNLCTSSTSKCGSKEEASWPRDANRRYPQIVTAGQSGWSIMRSSEGGAECWDSILHDERSIFSHIRRGGDQQTSS